MSNIGSNADPISGLTTTFNVPAGTHNPTIDAGLITPITGGLGNYVWLDANEDGQQDATEIGVPGVLVTLYASDGITALANTTTDGAGYYAFNNLVDANYIVGFSNIPLGYTRTKQIGAVSEALNSDIDASYKTGLAQVTGGTFNPNVDAGLYIGVPLPVTVKSFEAVAVSCGASLQWTVQNENGLAYYSVERKGKAGWEAITSIAAVGAVSEKQYSYRDLGLEAGMYAYRIRCVDVDGKYAYTATSNVHVDCDLVNAIQVYPNPANDLVTIEINSSVEGDDDYTITLSDLSGRILSSSTVVVNKVASVRVPVSHLAAGVYTLHIHSNNASYNRQISVR